MPSPLQQRDLHREQLFGMLEKSKMLKGDVGGIGGSIEGRIECGAVLWGEEGETVGWDGEKVRGRKRCDVVVGTNLNALVTWGFTKDWSEEQQEWVWQESERRDVVAILPGEVILPSQLSNMRTKQKSR